MNISSIHSSCVVESSVSRACYCVNLVHDVQQLRGHGMVYWCCMTTSLVLFEPSDVLTHHRYSSWTLSQGNYYWLGVTGKHSKQCSDQWSVMSDDRNIADSMIIVSVGGCLLHSNVVAGPAGLWSAECLGVCTVCSAAWPGLFTVHPATTTAAVDLGWEQHKQSESACS